MRMGEGAAVHEGARGASALSTTMGWGQKTYVFCFPVIFIIFQLVSSEQNYLQKVRFTQATYFAGMTVLERGQARGVDSGDSDTEQARIPVRSIWDYMEKIHKKSQVFFNLMWTPHSTVGQTQNLVLIGRFKAFK